MFYIRMQCLLEKDFGNISEMFRCCFGDFPKEYRNISETFPKYQMTISGHIFDVQNITLK